MEDIGEEKTTFQKKLADARNSPLKSYMGLTVGKKGLRAFILYELLTFFFTGMPGGLGLLLRKKLFPCILKSSGSGLVIGRNVTLRHPGRLEIGNNVTVDDNVLIDARGDTDIGVKLEDEVVLNRNVSLKAKNGTIALGKRTNVGGGSTIVSYEGVEIGDSVLIAGGCYINGGGYNTDASIQTMMERGVQSKGPIKIGNDVWIATGAIILDGVSIGNHAVIGAGAVVTKNVGNYEIAAGVPAKIIRNRLEDS
jgi:acetyltransferase-like isoleucine patch superfamily enzyme